MNVRSRSLTATIGALEFADASKLHNALDEYVASLDEAHFQSVVAASLRNSPKPHVLRFYEAAKAEGSARKAFSSVLSDISVIEHLPAVEKRLLKQHLAGRAPASRARISLSRIANTHAVPLAIAAWTIVSGTIFAISFVLRGDFPTSSATRPAAQPVAAAAPWVTLHAPAVARPERTKIQTQLATIAVATQIPAHTSLVTHVESHAISPHRIAVRKQAQALHAIASVPLLRAHSSPAVTRVAQAAEIAAADSPSPTDIAGNIVQSSDPQAVVQSATIVSKEADRITVQVTSAQDGATMTDRITLALGNNSVLGVERLSADRSPTGSNHVCYRRDGWYPC